jgi:hypothetical protein
MEAIRIIVASGYGGRDALAAGTAALPDGPTRF